ncbi:MAG: hypothetical protein HC863_03005 [Myxococcales bacterium]|nr:hypothetical protein [Myxococcales bacterium]
MPKHDGLSYFVLDMKAPGVEVRPLYQITGEAEFNEVFFNNVRIPHSRMLGKEGQGWRVAITTLMNERVAIGGGGAKKKGAGAISQLVKLWQGRKPGALSNAQEVMLRDRVRHRRLSGLVLPAVDGRRRTLLRTTEALQAGRNLADATVASLDNEPAQVG